MRKINIFFMIMPTKNEEFHRKFNTNRVLENKNKINHILKNNSDHHYYVKFKYNKENNNIKEDKNDGIENNNHNNL